MKFAVFDLDGVLIDSREANFRAFEAGIVAAGLNPPREEEVVRLIGLSARQMLLRLGCPEERVDDIYRHVVQPYYLENLPRQARAVEGAERVLSELQRREFTIVACTSGDRTTQQHALKGIGLWDYFVAMQTPDDSPHRKPDVAYLADLVEQIREGRSLEVVWHIEDSEVGLKMGLDYGARTVFADYGFGQPGTLQPHHRIARLEELLEIV